MKTPKGCAMKNILGICLVSLLAAAATFGESRTFTNKEGKEITAELIGVEKEDAVLKLANSSRVKVPVASLSDADQAFIKSWAEENKNNVTDSDIRLSIEKRSKRVAGPDTGKDKKKDAKKVSIDNVEFICELSSYTQREISGITANYTIYKRVSTRGKEGSGTKTETIDGSDTVASISANQKVTFETTGVTCEDFSQKGKKGEPASSKRETVIGIVVKLSVNGKEFLEQGYPDNFLDRLEEEEKRESED